MGETVDTTLVSKCFNCYEFESQLKKLKQTKTFVSSKEEQVGGSVDMANDKRRKNKIILSCFTLKTYSELTFVTIMDSDTLTPVQLEKKKTPNPI